MNLIYIFIPMAVLLGFGFLGAFIWSVQHAQFDDLETPAYRILIDEKNTNERKTT